jgi:hypothetical protein
MEQRSPGTPLFPQCVSRSVAKNNAASKRGAVALMKCSGLVAHPHLLSPLPSAVLVCLPIVPLSLAARLADTIQVAMSDQKPSRGFCALRLHPEQAGLLMAPLLAPDDVFLKKPCGITTPKSHLMAFNGSSQPLYCPS